MQNRSVNGGLPQAIARYQKQHAGKLTSRALRVLARLTENHDAAKAFERLKLSKASDRAAVITACIEADNIACTFPKLINKQKDLLSRAKQWADAVRTLRSLSKVIEAPPRIGLADLDLWSLSILNAPTDSDTVRNALELIASSIEWLCGIADANLAHVGATRDVHTKQAAQNAAIWILSAGIYDAAREVPLPGKPHVKEVADLAEVILEIEVSKDRVIALTKKRRELFLEMTTRQTKRDHSAKQTVARAASVKNVVRSKA